MFIERNSCVSGPTQFKPVLFKDPLYFWGDDEHYIQNNDLSLIRMSICMDTKSV